MLSPLDSHTWASCGVFVTCLPTLPFLLFINKTLSVSFMYILTPLLSELYMFEEYRVSS